MTGRDTGSVDIIRLLDELERLPDQAKHLPFNTLVGFNSEQFLMMVLKIRANLPEELKKAARVTEQGTRIVNEAQDLASQQVEAGKVKANQMIADAQREAARLVSEATATADRVRAEAAAEAGRTLDEANAESARLVEAHEVYQSAVAQSQELRRSAEEDAQTMRQGAAEYARDTLARLENTLSRWVATVQQSRALLDGADFGGEAQD